MICGGRYLSGDQAMRVFAADPDSSKPMRLEVKWRNGTESTLPNIRPNHIYEVDEAGALPRSQVSNQSPAANPFFKDVSSMLGHVHVENPFDDWAQQPSLPRRLSRLGPGVCWYDLDGDGWEDLIIAAAKGGKLALYYNEKGLAFRPLEGAPLSDADQGAVVGWSAAGGNRQVLVAVSNFEMKSPSKSQLATYSLTNLGAPLCLPLGTASVGPIALADINGDGNLDLFVGGRFEPARYPEPVSSTLWLNDGGDLKESPSASTPFKSLGLVSGATFADLDGDGWPDLALALEWGPVRVFRNNHGTFEEVTSNWGFAGRKGCWTSITAADVDGDGKLDLVVGNWGRNSSYELHPDAKLALFYGDWNSDGRLALIEAWQQETNWFPLHNRAWLAATIPELATPFPTHLAFAGATVPGILGGRYAQAKMLEVNELRSGIFLNRGSHFEWMPLLREAQLSPVFSINVGDFNGDGIEDLFLSQNCFSALPESAAQEALSRDDSGRGLWLRGNGQGTFTAVDGSFTGIKIYGEQRGAALADFNHDGRVDLVVAQNNGATKLFMNQAAKPGLRVALHGRGGNPDAVGAQLRVRYADGRLGPCRNVSAGTGYWSQDATTHVLGCANPPTGLWIRWPGGREEVVPVEKNTLDLEVTEHEPK
jgi:hypothetical protein